MPSVIMRSTIAAVIVPLTFAYSQAAHSVTADDVYLRCKGGASIFRDSGMQIVEKQEIAAHIKNGKISFSGNGLLLGENIPICTLSKDQPYFDSESCEGSSRFGKKRKYGTYNKITGALDLTNERSENNVALITGHFKCAKAEPLMK